MDASVIGVIPARYESSRFPGKPLTLLLGKPMIIWVAELTANALGKENTYIATDDSRISGLVRDYGYCCIITSKNHLTGTDRLTEVANAIEADIYLNIQGDEPTVNPNSILKVLEKKLEYPEYVINAMAKMETDEDPKNINIPKVVFNNNNDMVYMSRSPIPGFKGIKNKPSHYFKQVCIYGFSRDQLLKFGNILSKGTLEKYEDIEILRFLDINIPVKMVEVESNSYAVDTIEDVSIVESRLKEIHKI